MKQKQIMSRTKRWKFNKTSILFILILFSLKALGQEKDSIQFECKIRLYSFQKTEYAVLKIGYKNAGKDTLYLWTQHWRVHYLSDMDSGVFKNCQYDTNGGRLNAITFFNGFPKFSRKDLDMALFKYFNRGDTITNCNFIKKIPPGEVFYNNLMFSDSSLVSSLKIDKPQWVLLHFSYSRSLNKKRETTDNVFYKDDELIIYYPNNPNLVDCYPDNVVSRNGIKHKDDFEQAYNHGFKGNRLVVKLEW